MDNATDSRVDAYIDALPPWQQDICRTVEPPLRPFGPSHVAACHFPLQEPLEPRAAA